jgi:hypothetical protein
LAPSAQLSDKKLGGPLSGGGSRVDAEVEYWRRKIAELSAPSGRSADGGFHSTSLPACMSPSLPRGRGEPPLSRLNLSRPSYKAVRHASASLKPPSCYKSPAFCIFANQDTYQGPLLVILMLPFLLFTAQRSLAEEPLSWEGTASFADENRRPAELPRSLPAKAGDKGSDELEGEIILMQKISPQRSPGLDL